MRKLLLAALAVLPLSASADPLAALFPSATPREAPAVNGLFGQVALTHDAGGGEAIPAIGEPKESPALLPDLPTMNDLDALGRGDLEPH